MMQEPHLLHYSDGVGVVMMDTALLKCRGLGLSCECIHSLRGRWSRGSQALGGPAALADVACLRSLAATQLALRHFAHSQPAVHGVAGATWARSGMVPS